MTLFVCSLLIQDLFPETLMRAVIYPSDIVFYSIWAIAKWFVDPVTREKVQPMMYLSGVEQFIDRQYIPKSMVSSTFLCARSGV